MRAILALTLAAFVSLAAVPALAQPYGPADNPFATRDAIRQGARDALRDGLRGLFNIYIPVMLVGSVLMLTATQSLALRRQSLVARSLRDQTQRLKAALAQVERYAPQGAEPVEQILAVRVRNGKRLVRPTEIDVIRAADDYCELVLSRGDRLLHAATLEGLARQLPGHFRRVHRSVIVNLERIETLRRRASGGYELVTKSGEVLPVGRSYIADARRSLT